MKKPKIYINKDGDITIVFDKSVDSKSCNVTLVHDRGKGILKETNIFGNKLYRFIYHFANAYGDSGYSSSTDELYGEKGVGDKYKLTKEKRRLK